MYLQHFGLKRFPFDITSDPDFLWTGESHRQALSALQEGVLENRGFVVLTGEVGTGKTTLINAFRRLDDIATIIVTIPDPDMEVLDFFNFLANEFEIDGKFASPDEFVHAFKSFLLRAYASYQKVLIIIDEAQRLNNVLLAKISKLAKIEMAGRRLLKIFLVGQLEFNQILISDPNKAILEEVVAAERLEPISESQIQAYINHRLSVAGCARELFGLQAISDIYRHTGGLPRAINVLCDQALLKGFLAGRVSIDSSVIDHCAGKIRLPSQRQAPPVADLPISQELRESVQYQPVKQRLPWKIAGWVCLLLVVLMAGGFAAFRNAVDSDTPRKVLAALIELAMKFLPN